MAVAPADIESATISIVLHEWSDGQVEQFSPVHRIGGYPWRLRLSKSSIALDVTLICDKSTEAEFWMCTPTIKYESQCEILHKFTSWNEASKTYRIRTIYPLHCVDIDTEFNVEITINDDGESWRRRPTAPNPDLRDGILVIGEEKKKISVNRKFLASHSPFFDRLFNGDFMEKNLDEIPIKDVDYEEFSNVIQMIYGFDVPSMTEDNLLNLLDLADRFELMNIVDKIVNFILSSSTFSTCQKLLISEQYNLFIMKDVLLSEEYSQSHLKVLSASPDLEQLSPETLGAIFKKCTVSPASVCSASTTMELRGDNTESGTIPLRVERWKKNQHEQFSPVHHIGGYPWRLRLYANDDGKLELAVVCDKSTESEFWQCNATVKFNEPEKPKLSDLASQWLYSAAIKRITARSTATIIKKTHSFNSWAIKQNFLYYPHKLIRGEELSVMVTTTKDGESWRRHPTLAHPYPLDGILVIGDEKKTIEVNKEVLCSQSPYFNRLFNVDFTWDHMDEVTIEYVEYEELSKIIRMAYGGFSAKYLSEKELFETLQLADRFQLMEIVDKIVNFILSPSSRYSICQKIRISDQYNQKRLKEILLFENSTQSKLKELSNSPDLHQLCAETLVNLIKMSTKFF